MGNGFLHDTILYFLTIGSLIAAAHSFSDKLFFSRHVCHSSKIPNTNLSILHVGSKERSEDLGSLLLDALFGGLDNKNNKKQQGEKEEDPNKELEKFTALVASSNSTTDEVMLAHESLARFLKEWAFLLETDPGLSTPIMSTTKPLRRQRENALNSTSEETIKEDCVRIMFRPPPRYMSYNEQRDMEKGVLPDRKGAKLDSKSPGGVQVMIQTKKIIERKNYDSVREEDHYELHLVASRCAVDEDTLIKASSERIIIRRLTEAIRIWKKSRSTSAA